MSEAKFTSGPWIVAPIASSNGRYIFPFNTGAVVAEAFSLSRNGIEMEANAQLIASAPALYAALAAAETILILLKEEVTALGLRSENVLPNVQAVLRQARGEK